MPASSNSSPEPSQATSQVRVQIYGLLRLALGGLQALDLPWREGDTVRRMLEKFQAALPVPVTGQLVGANGSLLVGTIILVNRRNILHLEGLETQVAPGDVLALFPPGAGG